VIRPEEALETISKVTTREVREVAADLFRPENEALAEIKPL
jgi:predicted Zn-dependent peptidase